MARADDQNAIQRSHSRNRNRLHSDEFDQILTNQSKGSGHNKSHHRKTTFQTVANNQDNWVFIYKQVILILLTDHN